MYLGLRQCVARRIILFIIFYVNKTQYFFNNVVFSMATGGKDRLKSGHEDYNWVTRSQMIGPPEPHSTLRLSYAGTRRTAADKEASVRHDLKDVTAPS